MKLKKSSKSFVTCVLALSLATASIVPMGTPAFAVGNPQNVVVNDGAGGGGKVKTPAKKTSNKKKNTAPAKKKANTGVKKNTNAGAKKNTAPAKKNTAPAKKNTAPAKKNTAPAKKNTAPAKKNIASAKKNTAPAKKNNVAPKKDTAYKDSYEYKRYQQEQAKQSSPKKTVSKQSAQKKSAPKQQAPKQSAKRKSTPTKTPDRIANTYTISNEGTGNNNITYTLREAEKVAKNPAAAIQAENAKKAEKKKSLPAKKDTAYKNSYEYKSVMEKAAKAETKKNDTEAYKQSVLYIGADKGQGEKEAAQKKRTKEFFDKHPTPYWKVPNSREDKRVQGGIKQYMGEKRSIMMDYESPYPTVKKTTVKDIMEARKDLADGKVKQVKEEDRIPIQTLSPSYEAYKKYEGLFLSDTENERIGNYQVNEKGESYGLVGDKYNYRFKFIPGQEEEAEAKFALDRTWIDRSKIVSGGLSLAPSATAQTVSKAIDGTAAVISVADATRNAQNRAITYRNEGGTVVKESLHPLDFRNEEVFAPDGTRDVANEEYLNWDLYKDAGKDILDVGGHFIKAGLAEETLYNGASALAYPHQEKVVDTAVNVGKLALDVADHEDPTDAVSYAAQAGKILGVEGADTVNKIYKTGKGLDKEITGGEVFDTVNEDIKNAVVVEEPEENLPAINIVDGEGQPLVEFEEPAQTEPVESDVLIQFEQPAPEADVNIGF